MCRRVPAVHADLCGNTTDRVKLNQNRGICHRMKRTDVARLPQVPLLDPVLPQADDVTGLETPVPADAHAVPQHHTCTACAVAHLQNRLDTQNQHTRGVSLGSRLIF